METEKRLQVNHELLLGHKVKRYFTGYDGAAGTVKKYSLKQDAYYLTYADGHHEWIVLEVRCKDLIQTDQAERDLSNHVPGQASVPQSVQNYQSSQTDDLLAWRKTSKMVSTPVTVFPAVDYSKLAKVPTTCHLP